MTTQPTLDCGHREHRFTGGNAQGKYFELTRDDRVIERWEFCMTAALQANTSGSPS